MAEPRGTEDGVHDFTINANISLDNNHSSRSLHNDQLPINQCPSELLCLIFFFTIIWPWDDSMIYEMISLRTSRGGVHLRENSSVKNASQVCRRWREAALDDRVLWSHWSFYDIKNPNWLLELERRSRDALLTIRTMDGIQTKADYVLPRHTARFKKLEYVVCDGNIWRTDTARIRTLLTYTFPSLESLTLIYKNGATCSLVGPLFGGSAPRLKHLEFYNGYQDLYAPAFSNVRCVTFHSSDFLQGFELPAALRTKLELLTIAHCTVDFVESDFETVSLPHLHRLTVDGSPEYCCRWLGILKIPKNCSTIVTCYGIYQDPDQFDIRPNLSILADQFFLKSFNSATQPHSHFPWHFSVGSHQLSLTYKDKNEFEPRHSLELDGGLSFRHSGSVYLCDTLISLITKIKLFRLVLEDEAIILPDCLLILSAATFLAMENLWIFHAIKSYLHESEPVEDTAGGALRTRFFPFLARLEIRNIDLQDSAVSDDLKALVKRRSALGSPLRVLDVAGCLGEDALARDLRAFEGIEVITERPHFDNNDFLSTSKHM